MKTLTVISQKGGAGKTTIALFLAVASASAGNSTAIIDLDPQSSAATWGDSRELDNPVVVSAQASRLDKVLAEVVIQAGAQIRELLTASVEEDLEHQNLSGLVSQEWDSLLNRIPIERLELIRSGYIPSDADIVRIAAALDLSEDHVEQLANKQPKKEKLNGEKPSRVT